MKKRERESRQDFKRQRIRSCSHTRTHPEDLSRRRQGQRARINTLSNASDVLDRKMRKHNANQDRNLAVANYPLSCVAVPSFQSQGLAPASVVAKHV